MDATEYWDMRYSLDEGIAHHARQNEQIARDLVAEIKKKPMLRDYFDGKTAVEIGCGTGDLSNVMTDVLYCLTDGTDLSDLAVEIAKIRFPHLHFRQYDILRDPPCGEYDIAVASNVVEHFKDPHKVIKKMLKLAPKIFIVAPYGQKKLDGYDAEGGAGHASTICMGTFKPYNVLYGFTFRTEGWQHSSDGEVPMQIAVLLSRR